MSTWFLALLYFCVVNEISSDETNAISSGKKINVDAFHIYAMETAKIFIDLYPWYYMPASVHKMLIHEADVIRFAILPIGQLSEEAQEARNKDYQKIRLHDTRKSSKYNTNEDFCI